MVVQLVRIRACHARGRGFESRPYRKKACLFRQAFFYFILSMKHFVYIIYSNTSDIYYKGYSTDPIRRLEQHNNNESRYTSGKGPWSMVYSSEFENKSMALIEEKRIKKLNIKALKSLLARSSACHLVSDETGSSPVRTAKSLSLQTSFFILAFP